MEFRDLPSIDKLLRSEHFAPLITAHGAERTKNLLRTLQAEWRTSGNLPAWADDEQAYANVVHETLAQTEYQTVFNLTGTIIHTNLGRAMLSEALFQEVTDLVTQPMNLEYDLKAGARGDRDGVVEERLRVLTGADACTIVNNNAAALLLVLNTFALGRTVPVSRGELIEIGGSFRLPELMERAGCTLHEIGTTNRTHLKDFAKAIDERTPLLLKVHPSNYHISGFTREVSIGDLAKLAHSNNLPLCVDLGSGTLVDLERWGLPHEPTVQEVLSQGADLVTFSGDKLLGSVQAGLIVGGDKAIAALKQNPLKRALRPDKVTLALLDRTLALYEQPESLAEKLPLLKTLTTPASELEQRAREIVAVMTALLPEFNVEMVSSRCQLGSGSLPDQTIDSRAVRIDHDDPKSIRQLGERLRSLNTPVIGRIHDDALHLDMRGADRLEALCSTLKALVPST
ncbi:MAG: L-seryl-tRNA(Sec) selenium transferase [Gammaproteobacteria bacterium]|nr:L-seryl-tRNA(Sec) selenium transferase [Gammaproteobacteria bacterium]